jgi:phosphoenolpyruvate carboxykinase (GTP)
MGNREEHLRQFDGLPDAIWQAHYKMAKAFEA